MYKLKQQREEDYRTTEIDECQADQQIETRSIGRNISTNKIDCTQKSVSSQLQQQKLLQGDQSIIIIKDLMQKVNELADELNVQNQVTQQLLKQNQESEQEIDRLLSMDKNNQNENNQVSYLQEENQNLVEENQNLKQIIELKNQEFSDLRQRIISLENEIISQKTKDSFNNLFKDQSQFQVESVNDSGFLQQFKLINSNSQNRLLNSSRNPQKLQQQSHLQYDTNNEKRILNNESSLLDKYRHQENSMLKIGESQNVIKQNFNSGNTNTTINNNNNVVNKENMQDYHYSNKLNSPGINNHEKQEQLFQQQSHRQTQNKSLLKNEISIYTNNKSIQSENQLFNNSQGIQNLKNNISLKYIGNFSHNISNQDSIKHKTDDWKSDFKLCKPSKKIDPQQAAKYARSSSMKKYSSQNQQKILNSKQQQISNKYI